jgi:hypothetical protein
MPKNSKKKQNEKNALVSSALYDTLNTNHSDVVDHDVWLHLSCPVFFVVVYRDLSFHFLETPVAVDDSDDASSWSRFVGDGDDVDADAAPICCYYCMAP